MLPLCLPPWMWMMPQYPTVTSSPSPAQDVKPLLAPPNSHSLHIHIWQLDHELLRVNASDANWCPWMPSIMGSEGQCSVATFQETTWQAHLWIGMYVHVHVMMCTYMLLCRFKPSHIWRHINYCIMDTCTQTDTMLHTTYINPLGQL